MDYKEIFGEELATQIEATLKEKGINLIVDDKNDPKVPKYRLDEVIGQRNELKTQISELAGQLEGAQKASKSKEDYEAKIQELLTKNEEMTNNYQKTQLENAIKMKAIHEKARDINDLGKFLDYENLSLDENGNVKGLDEQLATLKEQKGYLFEMEAPPRNQQAMNPADSGTTTQQSDRDKYNQLYMEVLKSPNNSSLQNALFLQKQKLRQE